MKAWPAASASWGNRGVCPCAAAATAAGDWVEVAGGVGPSTWASMKHILWQEAGERATSTARVLTILAMVPWALPLGKVWLSLGEAVGSWHRVVGGTGKVLLRPWARQGVLLSPGVWVVYS